MVRTELDLIGSMKSAAAKDKKKLKNIVSPDLSKMKREQIDKKTWVFR